MFRAEAFYAGAIKELPSDAPVMFTDLVWRNCDVYIERNSASRIRWRVIARANGPRLNFDANPEL